MINFKKIFVSIILFYNLCIISISSIEEQFKQVGYIEIFDKNNTVEIYNSLYKYFDELILFFQANPAWEKKLYIAKDRFIRSKYKSFYSTDFFGFYDESKRIERSQVSFYYSKDFHEFVFSYYPEFKKVHEIANFFKICFEIQKPTENIFQDFASKLNLKNIFSSQLGHVPVILKVIKYLPAYRANKPHYDGTAFSLFLDSTNDESLLICPYKLYFSKEDFFCVKRNFSRSVNQNSVLLIPGTLLTDFSIYPTPHIVLQSGKTRYSTIAFAMRSNSSSIKYEFSTLPNFNFTT